MRNLRPVLACLWIVLGGGVAFAGTPPISADKWGGGLLIVVEDKPRLAGEEEPIFLASNHVGWNPGDPSMELERRSDGRWQIFLSQAEADEPPLRFKFTRGTWDLVEVGAELEDIPNREAPMIDPDARAPGRPVVVELVIEKWADQRPEVAARRALDPYRRVEATGDLRRLQVVGGAGPAGGQSRDLLVWLPAGYADPENAERRYPVLYLMDGQNVFERLASLPAEWRVDETLTQAIRAGAVREMIVVGVPHAGPYRANEYLPFPAYGYEAHADGFIRFLTGEVMPRVERAFRVSRSREETGIGGSSLGALISLYAWLERPETFGLLLLESPAQLGPDSAIWRLLEGAGRLPERVSIGVGGQEAGEDAERELNEYWVMNAERLRDWFVERGMDEDDVRLVVQQPALHDERAWAERFGAAAQHLFGRAGR